MTEPILLPPNIRRQRFGLSLRVLMVLVLAVGGMLGWMARRTSTQRRAVADIRDAGGTVYYDHQIQGNLRVPNARPWAPDWLRALFGDELFREVEQVHFVGPIVGPPNGRGPTADTLASVATLDRVKSFSAWDVPIDDAGLASLDGMSRLEILELSNTAITDLGLERLAHLPALDSLMIRAKPRTITARALTGIARLPRLRSLFIVGGNFTDPSGLAALGTMVRLEKLFLQATPRDDSYLVHLKGLAGLKSLVLVGTEATEAGLGHLAGLVQLESLGLGGAKLTDAGLARLAKFSKLEELSWRSTPLVTDAGLAHLAGLKSLRSLNLVDSKATEAGLDHLAGLPLEFFTASGIVVTDAGLARLIARRSFLGLNLSGTAITDAGAAALAAQRQLREVGLGGSKVTDAALPGLVALPDLMTLILPSTEVTDAGLALIPQALKLNYLDIRGTKVTPSGVAAFRKARPGVTVREDSVEANPR